MPRHFSSVDRLSKRKPFEVVSNTGTEGRNASNVVEDVFIVMLNVVSECVCLSSVVKCVTVLCVASLFSVSLWLLFFFSEVKPLNPESPNSSVIGLNLKGEWRDVQRRKEGENEENIQFFNDLLMCVFCL